MPDKCEHVAGLNGREVDRAFAETAGEETRGEAAIVLDRAWSQSALPPQVFSEFVNNSFDVPLWRSLYRGGNETLSFQNSENPL